MSRDIGLSSCSRCRLSDLKAERANTLDMHRGLVAAGLAARCIGGKRKAGYRVQMILDQSDGT